MSSVRDYTKYPWYFELNKVLEAWKFSKKAQGITVDLVDTCVDFSRPQLQERNASSVEECKFADFKFSAYKIHGTAMAGLICGKRGALAEEYSGTSVNVAGIAPKALVRTTDTGVDQGIGYQDVAESLEIAKKARPDMFKKSLLVKQKIILINLSGGEKYSENAPLKWGPFILEDVCKDQHSLLIASVGNGAKDLDSTKGESILPAGLKAKSCLIRVGAISEHKVGGSPALYANSNFGKYSVDILAPGHKIPMLLPEKNKAFIGGGTSEAAAIVTGALALMAKCIPNASAKELRDGLLQNAKQYNHLEQVVDSGRVLDIYKAVEIFCKTLPEEENICLAGYDDIGIQCVPANTSLTS